jgi:hypothetical protein
LRIAAGKCGKLTLNPGKAIIILAAGGEKYLNNVAGDYHILADSSSGEWY